MNNVSDIFRSIFALLGAVLAILEPTLPYILICTLLILADCFTAWQLGKRVAKAHPERVKKDRHKFASSHFGKVLITLLKSYFLVIAAYLIQSYITNGLPIDLTNIAAGAICFWQSWSILENESSCNGSKWARTLQKILVDKTERHFDVDLSELDSKNEAE